MVGGMMRERIADVQIWFPEGPKNEEVEEEAQGDFHQDVGLVYFRLNSIRTSFWFNSGLI